MSDTDLSSSASACDASTQSQNGAPGNQEAPANQGAAPSLRESSQTGAPAAVAENEPVQPQAATPAEPARAEPAPAAPNAAPHEPTPAKGALPMPGRQTGYWVAGFFALLLGGLVAWSQYFIAIETNDPVCTKRISAEASNKKAIFPDAAPGTAQVVHLHGHLCVALNVKNYFGPTSPEHPENLAFSLFIDGKNTGITTTGFTRPDSDGWLWLDWKIVLPDASDAKDVWKSIVGQPNPLKGSQNITVGLTEDGDTPKAIVNSPALLDLYDPKMVGFGAALLAALGATIFYMNKNSGLFRDGTGRTEAGELSTYSLAKAQMGIWTLLILGGFLFVWIITGRSTGIMTIDIVGLMGIQLATGLAAVYTENKDDRNSRSSRSFFEDILSSDGVSPALQRIQMLAWTLVIAFIFLNSVFTRLSFPSIDPSLLALLGLVNSTYLGFKFPKGSETNEGE